VNGNARGIIPILLNKGEYFSLHRVQLTEMVRNAYSGKRRMSIYHLNPLSPGKVDTHHVQILMFTNFKFTDAVD